MNCAPAVSICVPTFNRRCSLARTLTSLLVQTYRDFELIVSDDGSSDGTEEIVRSMNDQRIRYSRNPVNLGLYANWNRCLELARGEFVSIYHDHDIYDPRIVELSVRVLADDPGLAFVFTGCQVIDEQGKVIYSFVERWWPGRRDGKKVARIMARRWASPMQASTVMARRASYQKVGGYPTDLGYGGDLDMWSRLSIVGDAAYIALPLVQTPIRTFSDAASRTAWEDICGHVRIQERNVERSYADTRLALYLWRGLARFRRDYEYLKFMAKALGQNESNLICQGRQIIIAEGGLLLRGFVQLFVGSFWLCAIIRGFRVVFRVIARLRMAYLLRVRFRSAVK